MQRRRLWSGTFHSIGNRLLREYAQVVGLEPSFSVLDRGDAADLLDFLRQELGLAKKEKRFPRKDTCLAIYSHRVNSRQPLARTLEESFPWCSDWDDELTQLFRRYVEVKHAQQLLDYDDLLLYWHVLVQEERVARDIGARFEHVLVDEYQDTNTLQAEILLAMKPNGVGCLRGRRRCAVDLFVPRRDGRQHPGFSRPLHAAGAGRQAGAELPLGATDPRCGERADERQRRGSIRRSCARSGPRRNKPSYVAVQDDQAQALYVVEHVLAAREQGTLLRRRRCFSRSSHHSDVLELELLRRNIPYVKYGGLKFLEAAHVKDVLAVLRWADNPRNRIAAFRVLQLLPGVGPATADRCLKVFEASGFAWPLLAEYRMPAAAEAEWSSLMECMSDLMNAREWPGQLGRLRKWYEPQLERIYDAAKVRAGDIEQLERLSGQFATREQFLTELTLDPPQVTGDLAGDPLLDEDYLILSTVHSAKGQEWDSVYVLNVADGNFPNEHATGRPELIEEERRLLYVAMTRAKHDLHLIAPLKYYVTQQSRTGDAHVYGARSRFMTDQLLAQFEQKAWPATREAGNSCVRYQSQRARRCGGGAARDVGIGAWNSQRWLASHSSTVARASGSATDFFRDVVISHVRPLRSSK